MSRATPAVISGLPYCSRHRSYKGLRYPTADCRACRQGFKQKHIFTLAILKGLVEKDDPYRHFGSTAAFKHHLACAVDLGVVVYDLRSEHIIVTDPGRRLYEVAKLKDCPDTRAYFWVIDPWFKET